MKKLLSLLIVMLLIFTFTVGCQPQETPPAEEPPAEEPPAEEPQDEEEEEPEEVTGPSFVTSEEDLVNDLSENGTWIVIFTEDMTTEEELVVEGEFRDKGDPNNDLYRKLALYAQDEQRNVTERYTLTAPKMTVRSPNFKIQGGTFKGDVYVEAEGMIVQDATIDGNVYFANQEYKDSFTLEAEGNVTGTTEVQ